MSRRNRFLLSIIAITFILCHNYFIGHAFGQSKAKNEPYTNSISTGKILVVENTYRSTESSGKDDPSLIQKQKEKHDKDASVGIKEVIPVRKAQKDEEREKGRDIMEEALVLLNESRAYWIKGDLENALDLLDQAYALLLDTNGEPDIARQKDDLRLLISKQLLAIYSSKHTKTNGKRSEIPHIINSDVEKEIRLFQTVEKDFFIQSYKRSGSYRPIIVKELKKPVCRKSYRGFRSWKVDLKFMHYQGRGPLVSGNLFLRPVTSMASIVTNGSTKGWISKNQQEQQLII